MKNFGLIIYLPALLLVMLSAEASDAPHLQGYDNSLCVRAQRIIVNSGPADFIIVKLSGQGEGFHSIQMDAQPGVVTIATTVGSGHGNEGSEAVDWVGCKMVNQERVNDVLELALAPTSASCRTVNEYTYDRALAELSPEQRERYELKGRKLRFADDYIAASGGEWLPSKVHDYITADSRGLIIRAPSVRVPWVEGSGEFYQGTHHCKLISLAAMQLWLTERAFTDSREVFPHDAGVCEAPSSMTSAAGSCRFWFAPAQAMFCQDYSGSQWNEESTRRACAERHASPEAQVEAGNRYAGAGGIYSQQACADRIDSELAAGTCVFHCGDADETLWHTPATDADSPAAMAMMTRACDLYIDRR